MCLIHIFLSARGLNLLHIYGNETIFAHNLHSCFMIVRKFIQERLNQLSETLRWSLSASVFQFTVIQLLRSRCLLSCYAFYSIPMDRTEHVLTH